MNHSSNDWKKRLGTVYSTNPDFDYENEQTEEHETLPPGEQKLYISLDRRQRKGKVVTLIKGFKGKTDDLEDLGKTLKRKCGTGGSVKEGEIIIQGDFKQRIGDLLKSLGYETKFSGG